MNDLATHRISRKTLRQIIEEDTQPVVPPGQLHVDAAALKQARRSVPTGEFHLEGQALKQALRNVPEGEFHSAA